MPTIRDRFLGTVPKYRRHRRSGQAVVSLAGRDHYLGPWGSKASKAEYDRLVAEWLAAGRPDHQAAGTHDLTVVELFARYWAFAERYYRKHGQPTGSLKNIRYAIKAARELYGTTLAVNFSPLSLKAIQYKLIAAGNGRTTINDRIDCIRRVFKWSVAEGLLPVTVYQALACVPGLRRGRSDAKENAPVQPVDDATIAATLPHLPPVVAAMVKLQRLLGCRPGEVCIMRPCDVDRSADVWTYRPASHKMEHRGRERTVFVGPLAQRILSPYLLRPADAFCFSPAESEAKRLAAVHDRRVTPLSCGNKPGSNVKPKPKRKPHERYLTEAYNRAVARACVQAGVEAWSVNRLRHARATEVRRLRGLEAASVTLGHARCSTTEIYAERDYNLAIDVARQTG